MACKLHYPSFSIQTVLSRSASLGTTRNIATACGARMAARYDLRSKQARLHASAAGCSWEKKPKPPGIGQVADFAMLPIALLQPILAQVPFKQKMKCEAVCRAWRSVLRSAACLDTTTFISSAGGVWGHLIIDLDNHAERHNVYKTSPITVRSYGSCETSIVISEALDPDMPPEADFVKWLRLRAPAADKITITNTSAHEGWLFAEVLLAVSGCGRLGVSKPPVALIAGSCNMLTATTIQLYVILRHRQRACSGFTADSLLAVKNCPVCAGSHSVLQSFRFCQLLSSSLTKFSSIEYNAPLELGGVPHLSALTKLTDLTLTDSAAFGDLTELKHLRQLHYMSVANYMEGPFRALSLTNIQNLTLFMETAQTVNLCCCTQLTFLRFDISSRLQTIALPVGDSVRLHTLHMTSEEGINPLLVMSNLSYASRLVTLHFDSVYPSNLQQGDWPLCMPELQVIVLRKLHCQPPQQLCKYPKLHALNLCRLGQSDLPPWFAELTQITRLQLSCSELTAFPMAIIQLSQLCILHLNDIEPPMVIGPEIANVLKWRCLEHIDLTADGYSLDSQLCLLEVYRQLNARNVQMDFVRRAIDL